MNVRVVTYSVSGQYVPPEIQDMVDKQLARQAANRERRMQENEQFTKVVLVSRGN